MGIFSNLKELFNKNIECGEDMNNHIVFFLNKKKYLYINKNIIVRDGSVCVVVYNHRVCDVILPGKYKINEQSIPETYSRAKIEKLNKKGVKVRKIRVNLYYVNTNEIKNFNFDSNIPFLIKSKESGRIKGLFRGMCNFRVIDAGLLIRSLIAIRNIEKTKFVYQDIGIIIGNRINKKIKKEKITLDMIFNNHEYINSILNTDLEDGYDDVGLFVKNIKLKAVNFSKRNQIKVNNYLSQHKRVIQNSNINNANWQVGKVANNTVTRTISSNTMQNGQNVSNLNDFKICNKCGFKIYNNDNKCRNCGSKFL